MARIRYQDSRGRDVAHDLHESGATIGRKDDCEIPLGWTGLVSRKHARIEREGSGWVIRDLDSSNGTHVNDAPATGQPLQNGDRIRVGDVVLRFEDGGTPVVGEVKAPGPVGIARPHPRSPERPEKTHTGRVLVQRPVDDAGELTRAFFIARKTDYVRRPGFVGETSAPPNHLLSLVRIVESMRRCHSEAAVCQAAVDLAMSTTGAQRGVLAFRAVGSATFDTVVQRSSLGKDGEVRISRTFSDKAVRERIALIAHDTEENPTLAGSESVQLAGIRSILCTPLCEGDDIVGFLYLDTVMSGAGGGRRFRDEDLDLVTTIGHHTASEVARFRLTDGIRVEATRRRNLARFLSSEVIQHIEEEGRHGELDPSGSAKEQEVTVLFADIANFTSYSERVSPLAVKALLDDYFDRMTEILIDHHGGTLDKYIGDGIMSLFGAPYSRGVAVDAASAVAAAIEMRDTVLRLRAERPEYEPIRIRIGINTGRVIAGMLGSKRRLEYSVIGDSVNVASRLESTCESDRIQIGEGTYQAVGERFECEFSGERTLRNRLEPVKCWWVLGVKL